ncbi:MAG: hypothetical protein OEY49_11005, partial [Candidatus Heimdallarchaeota archaeon]|nr:hypothetical protein [Candidatus Heimdallarchaeota archaeon]
NKLPEFNEVCNVLKEYSGLENLLFTLFTNGPTVLLGNEIEIRNFIFDLLKLLPPKVAKLRTFISYTDRLDNTIDWVGLPSIQKSTSIISGLEFTHTIISIPKKRAVSAFECTLINDLTQHIKNLDEENSLQMISDIFSKSNIIRGEDDVTKIADILNCPLSDAQFLKDVVKTHSLQEEDFNSLWRN